ncbi:hypothetical protein Ga0061079_11629 [Apibacter mensalis]|uniref:Uncharacterized protein n=1 Tax=Apibacter mensalis TaxID=1586267 RepID=A0A0X3AST1_9FLAO|nr:hypothetical protein [Apibacter mensalis]CVK17127.1 hypothetical protein Ga0061079_11629 [Apibacter mensalis]
MALDKESLQAGIKSLLSEMLTRDSNSIDEFSKRLSSLIDNYVKTATIKYDGGLSSPNGAVIGTFKGKLE